MSSSSLPADAAFERSVADRAARLNVALKRLMGVFAGTTLELTVVEARLLLLVSMSAPTTVNALAERSDIDRTQISRSLSALQKRGLVARCAGTTDRRQSIVQLSRTGMAVHRRLLKQLVEQNAALLSDLPDSQVVQFFATMDLLIERARTRLVATSDTAAGSPSRIPGDPKTPAAMRP